MPKATKPHKDEIERKVRERAYALWEADGRLPGRDLDYWFRAEAELNPPNKPRVRKTATTNGARSSRTAEQARTKRTPVTTRKKRPS
jgi:hypothetical protein